MIHLMNKCRSNTASADPACNEPSEARLAACTCCGGTRRADPTAYYAEALTEFVELSRELARLAVAEARDSAARRGIVPAAVPAEPAAAAAEVDAEEPAGSSPAAKQNNAIHQAGLTLHRLSRSVRLCIGLSAKLQEERSAQDKKQASDASFEVGLRKERLKGKVGRLVGAAIRDAVEKEAERLAEAESESEACDESEFDEEEREDALLEALYERLGDEDIDQDLGRCPVSEILGRLCDYLEIPPPWERWRREPWAMDEARRKVPGSPYAEPPPAAAAAEPEAKPEPAEAGPEPVEVEPPQPEPLQPEPDEPAASAPERPEPEPAKPEPDNPYEARMKARLAMAMRSGAWIRVLQTDPMLASYVQTRLNNSS
jgi:hypothetical protein